MCIRRICLIVCMFFIHICHATDLVIYNLRIRRSFESLELTQELDKPFEHWEISILPIAAGRKDILNGFPTNDTGWEKHMYYGTLIDLQYSSRRNWWLEGTTAIAHEHVTYVHSDIAGHASRTGFDDFLFTAGYNFFPNKCLQAAAYFVAGIPSTMKVKKFEFNNPLVGNRLFAVGAGGELSYGFIEQVRQALVGIMQLRIVHFLPRHYFPILPCKARYYGGNVTDCLVALHYRYKRHQFETGYDASMYTNNYFTLHSHKVLSPFMLRNSVYGSYEYDFVKIPATLGFGILGDFAHIGMRSRGWNAWITAIINF